MEAISKTSKIERIIKLTLLTIIGSVLITISAKVKIPFYPVPMTMQTFVILLIGITLAILFNPIFLTASILNTIQLFLTKSSFL